MSKYTALYLKPLPPTPELAKYHNEGRYYSDERCIKCRNKTPIRYVESGNCYGCLQVECKANVYDIVNNPNRHMDRLDFPAFPRDAHSMGLDYYFTGSACLQGEHAEQKSITSGKCLSCKPKVSPRQKAIAAGGSHYVPDVDCARCHTRAEKRVDNGACSGCKEKVIKPKSPRQKAKAAGESHYMPDTACTDCHTIALRAINNGVCTNCTALARKANPRKHGAAQHEASAELMNSCPDIVLARDEAKAMGFKVFRTGEYCRKGHTGFRYISTGACVACKYSG